MDFQPLCTIRPLTRLLTQTLDSCLHRPTERLTFLSLDALQSAALCELAPHHHLLGSLRTKLDVPPVQNSSAADVLPLAVARRLLSGLHRFPVASTDALYARLDAAPVPTAPFSPSPWLSMEDVGLTGPALPALAASLTSTAPLRAEIEALVISRHVGAMMATSSTTTGELPMSTSDVGMLWSVMAQCRDAAHPVALIKTFSLVDAAIAASPEDWCALVLQLSHAPSEVPFTSGRDDVLRDVLGVDMLWQRTLGFLNGPQLTAAQRISLTTAVMGLGQALRACPDDVAAKLVDTPLTTLNAGSLYVICHHLHLLQQPWLPPGVPAVVERALQDDLWSVYVDRDVDGLVMFLLYGTLKWPATTRATILSALRDVHMAALQRRRAEGGAVRPNYGTDLHVAVLLVSVVCEGKDALADAEVRSYWSGLAACLVRQSPPSSSSSSSDAAAESPASVSRSSTVDTVRPLMAAYVAILLEYVKATAEPLPASCQPDAEVMLAVCARSLSPDVLQARGSARLLSLLLTHAPTVTRHLGLTQTAESLLCAHALTGGFGRQQLAGLVRDGEGDEGAPALLSDAARRSVRKAAAVLPQRGP